MKKLIFCVLAGLALVSCATKPLATNNFYYTSYKPLTQEGLFVTPSPSVSFEYESLGQFMMESNSGYIIISSKPKAKKDNTKNLEDGLYTSPKRLEGDKDPYHIVNSKDAMQELTKYLKALKADGIIGISVNYIYFPGTTILDKIIINGTAIKRK